ncbi:MAG: hypothetical protein HQK51_13885 [Oligoflexia bacterium]|nr:hypothetical protein [Oligoflexia bacterium]
MKFLNLLFSSLYLIILTAATIIFLNGCTFGRWYNENRTLEEVKDDQYKCELSSNIKDEKSYSSFDELNKRRCMESKGYKQQ